MLANATKFSELVAHMHQALGEPAAKQ